MTSFEKKYHNQNIEFDASICFMDHYRSSSKVYKTRWDFLICPGDYDPDSQRGPNFKLKNQSFSTLNIEGNHESVKLGDNIRITARVDSYEQKAVFFI
ncbi:DUF4839 domain-containing protein [Arcanobacterium phocisimile]|uniref:DUF4839 domain-containing protein n=1 Tax=Arcanobacterium phocisimile TaxID=1302235 RepID=UPI003B836EA9